MNPRIIGLFAAALFGVSTAAMASTITYDFTVATTNGPLAGDTAMGSFSFNSSIIPAGGGSVDAAGLLTGLTFTWDGIAYNASNANTGFLDFNASGALVDGCFGNNSIANSCLVNQGTEQWAVSLGTSVFAYSVPQVGVAPTAWLGTVSFSPASVPEPATLALLGSALAVVGFVRRRKFG